MADKMIQLVSIRDGREFELAESVLKATPGILQHLEAEIKPTVQKLTKKEVIRKIKEAKTIEELAIIVEGEDREECLAEAQERKSQLSK